MDIKFSNNASSYLIEAMSTESTNIVLAPDTGRLFPVITLPTDYFMLTLSDASANLEIVKVIARDGDELTVERAQEGTIARDFPINSIVDHRLTAGSLMHILNEVIATEINPGRIRVATKEEVIEGKSTDSCIPPAYTYLFQMPENSIVMYSGSVDQNGHPISTGGEVNESWALCDGRNGTPDLRSSFIIGSSIEYPMHSTGGSNAPRVVDVPITTTHGHALTIDQMPAHTHKAHQCGGQVADDGKNQRAAYSGYLDTSWVGGNQPHAHGITPITVTLEALPRYYALSHIMKIG